MFPLFDEFISFRVKSPTLHTSLQIYTNSELGVMVTTFKGKEER